MSKPPLPGLFVVHLAIPDNIEKCISLVKSVQCNIYFIKRIQNLLNCAISFSPGWSMEKMVVIEASQHGTSSINWWGKAEALAGIHQYVVVKRLQICS